MKRQVVAFVAAIVLPTLPAAAADDAGSRFHVGVSYVSHLADLRDKIELNNPLVEVEQLTSVGLALSGYYLFASGVGLGAAVGPAVVATGDASFYIVPLSAGVRYQFVRTPSMAAYVGAAVEKHLVGGDFITSGSAGVAATVALEFSKPRGFGGGIEVGYHSADVTVNATPGRSEKKARPGRYTVGVFFLF